MNKINISRIDLNLLVVFDAVSRARSVTRAAAVLNLTPSAVSHGLNRLRRLLGDPLFVKVPKGVVPTELAVRLAPDIERLLSEAERIFSGQNRFDPALTSREFVIGVTDAVAAVVIPRLVNQITHHAPYVRLNIRPLQHEMMEQHLDQRDIDIALSHEPATAARFTSVDLYTERFSVVTRGDHAFVTNGSLDAYCTHHHVLVSPRGDATGFVDLELQRLGRHRHITAVVPSFFLALAILRNTDLIATLPDTLAADYASEFGLVRSTAPLHLQEFRIQAVLSHAMLSDDGLNWLVQSITRILSGIDHAADN